MTTESAPALNEHLEAILPILPEDEVLALQAAAKAVNTTDLLAIIEAADKSGLNTSQVQNIKLAAQVADLSNKNVDLAQIAYDDKEITTLAGMARAYDAKAIAEKLPDGESQSQVAEDFAKQLFIADPTSTVAGLVSRGEISMGDPTVDEAIVALLDHAEVDISTLQTTEALSVTFEEIQPDVQVAAVDAIKTIRRVGALTSSPSAIGPLVSMKFHSANSMATMSSESFLAATKDVLAEPVAQEIHAMAVSRNMAISNTLFSAIQASHGTGMQVLDAEEMTDNRMDFEGKTQVDVQKIVKGLGEKQVNWEALFGSNDEALVEDSSTVYSPAAYLVDLLQYLRKVKSTKTETNALGMLLHRRPDLADLQLSRENTEVPIPYIDLANEVMESFIADYGNYRNADDPKTANIIAYNVQPEQSPDVLWQPQNTEMKAYGFLAESVYPLTLPYHQPIDTARIYLKFLGIDRAELIDTFRSRMKDQGGDKPNWADLHLEKTNRLHDAESLGLTEEEYVLLTEQSFQTKEYYNTILNIPVTRYDDEVGCKPTHSLYGYQSIADLQARDNTGLESVKLQFLRRTKISWQDLVEIVQTKYINPDFPSGKSQRMLEAFGGSYRYLQTLIDPNPVTEQNRKTNLINTMFKMATERRGIQDTTPNLEEISAWAKNEFEAFGQVIVLESGEHPFLRLEPTQDIPKEFSIEWSTSGKVATGKEIPYTSLTLREDGIMVDQQGRAVGNVDQEGTLLVFGQLKDGTGILKRFPSYTFKVYKLDDERKGDSRSLVASVGSDSKIIKEVDKMTVSWAQTARNGGSSSIDSIKLMHLDGAPLTDNDWRRLQKFIRLWKKLGWSASEVDMAITGLQSKKDSRVAEINPDILHELTVVKDILSLTSFSVEKTLALWTNLPTTGENSAFRRVFLKGSILRTDTSYKPDKYGVFFSSTKPMQLSSERSTLLASLNLSGEDILAVLDDKYSYHLEDKFNLENLSALYRYKILSDFLQIKVSQLLPLLDIFTTPLSSPTATLDFLKTCLRLRNMGFNIDEMRYVTTETSSSLSVNDIKVLVTCKQIQDELLAISGAHQNLYHNQKVTDDLLRSKASIIFDERTVSGILQFLQGTTVYNAVIPGDFTATVSIPENLTAKVKYFEQDTTTAKNAHLEIVGFLTSAELKLVQEIIDVKDAKFEIARGLVTKAVEDYQLQLRALFDSVLFGVFKDPTPLLQAEDKDARYRLFLSALLEYLRTKLSHNLIISKMAAVVGTSDLDITAALLKAITNTVDDKSISALESLLRLGSPAEKRGKQTRWDGYLLVPQTDDYVLHVNSADKPSGFFIDNKEYDFEFVGSGSGSATSSTDRAKPIRLYANQLYRLKLFDVAIEDLQWQVSGSPRTAVPSSALLPDLAQFKLQSLFDRLHRAAIVADKFALRVESIQDLADHQADFDGLNFNSFSVQQLRRLGEYSDFCKSLPASPAMSLRSLFNWAALHKSSTKVTSKGDEDATLLPEKISLATGWDKARITEILLEADFYHGDTHIFVNEKHLVRLQKMLKMAQSANVGIPMLFEWSRPVPRKALGSKKGDLKAQRLRSAEQFVVYDEIARSIQLAVKSKISPEAYASALRPLNDKLRENQRNAMIDYILNLDEILLRGVIDADSLFEFFLIDVQMTSLVETSRIQQAIATVQLFVQRCFLGLERDTVLPESLDGGIWEWMKNYSTWAANRKVFLYPENWIDPGLRDDKTTFFKELDGGLLQKEITHESITNAFTGYVSKLTDIANLEPVTLFIEESGSKPKTFHFFARTRTAPFTFWYRTLDFETKYWAPWEKMDIEIPSYTTRSGANGVYLIPVMLGQRLIVFIPQITVVTITMESSTVTLPSAAGTDYKVPYTPKQYDIKMSWTEYRNGKWTPRYVGSESFQCTQNFTKAEKKEGEQETEDIKVNSSFNDPIESFFVTSALLPSREEVVLQIFTLKLPNTTLLADPSWVGDFKFTGSQIIKAYETDIPSATRKLLENDIKSKQSANQQFYFNKVKTNEIKVFSTQTKAISTGADVSLNKGYLLNIAYLTYGSANPKLSLKETVIGPEGTSVEKDAEYDFTHTLAPKMLNSVLTPFTNVSELRKLMTEQQSLDFWGGNGIQAHELARPYAIYNWELGLHIPMLLADRLLQSQQFDEALAMCRLVFDPQPSSQETGMGRFWNFRPFKEIKNMSLEDYLLKEIGMMPGREIKMVSEWRSKPFLPHLVARQRPLAYMKWVVAKYIEILVAYGDFYFRQNTLESIPSAIQMYILAAHLYGPRGQQVPRRKPRKAKTYKDLQPYLDDFSNAIVEMEEIYPFSNQIVVRDGKTATGAPGFSSIFGFASTFHFSIPDNPKIRQLRALIDDRLFKLRHSQDINGVQRKLPLFEPPVDPALLVKAAAQGIQISSVLSAIDGPMPNYRFQYILGRALELATEVKGMGASLLASREKYDAETSAALRARHEKVAYGIALDVRRTNLLEAEAALKALEESRKGPLYRLKFYLQNLGLESTALPDIDTDFQELALSIQKPVDEGGLKLISYEKEEQDKYGEAQSRQSDVGALELTASIFHALPNVTAHATPLGCGVAVTSGPSFYGQALQATAQYLRMGADKLTYEASGAGRKASSLRGMYDRYLQANTAGYELKAIDKQILAARIRVDIAKKEIENQQKQLDQATEFEEYLRTKYTNADLYSWMQNTTKSLFYDIYNQAYDLAAKAVKTFKYERPNDRTDYLQPSYWDSGRDGLLSGEKLWMALKRLETAYQENRGYDYELSKNISLRHINPVALLTLRETGSCTFDVPEAVFDLDFPGHYLRRIKCISVSIPCIVGPYTSVSATLRLDSHKYRISSLVEGSGYPEKTGSEDPRFTTTNVPITSIGTSTAHDDAGQFELSFKDERYIPFEGAGAISTWTLDLPDQYRQFNYQTISDVVLHMRYTSLDGGGKLKSGAVDAIGQAIGDESFPQHMIIDLKNEYPSAWVALVGANSEKEERTFQLPVMENVLPSFTRGSQPTLTGSALSVSILSDEPLPPAELLWTSTSSPVPPSHEDGPSNGNLNKVTLSQGKWTVNTVNSLFYPNSKDSKKDTTPIKIPIKGKWTLSFEKGQTINATRVWMLVTYTLAK
ncbi:putative toxin subunit [Phaeomoniella chlamydospora]|uniref:Putative toxin subunit n=1 Tax=Phaeomoniella chlamydospora TaxID=158046 RepID=A0A0G2E656_PHACM|nr:putative toxin subunit [Phaeomoniella chlamydospora]